MKYCKTTKVIFAIMNREMQDQRTLEIIVIITMSTHRTGALRSNRGVVFVIMSIVYFLNGIHIAGFSHFQLFPSIFIFELLFGVYKFQNFINILPILRKKF